MGFWRNLKYIILDIFDNVYSEVAGGYNAFSKPRNLLQAMLWLIIIMILTKNLELAETTLALYVMVYIVLIIQRGGWKHKLRESYKIK